MRRGLLMCMMAGFAAYGEAHVTREFLDRIAIVESGGDPSAFNASTGAYGLYQIRIPYLSDANKVLGTDYTLEDMFDREKAERVVKAYLGRWGAKFQERHGRPPTDEELARIHNGGPRGAERSSTLRYAERFRNAKTMEVHNGV